MTLLFLSFSLVSGCSINAFRKAVYVPDNVIVEVRRATLIPVWIRDDNGVVHKGFVIAGNGWLLGKPKGFK